MGRLLDIFIAWLASRGSCREIHRLHEGSDELYLMRYHIFRCRWLNIYLHNFFLSDEEDLHCHPWANISILLRGGFIEHHHDHKVTTRVAGDVWWRSARELHRIQVISPSTTWSLFIHGRRTREWGFLKPGGWEVADNSGYRRLTGVLFPRFDA